MRHRARSGAGRLRRPLGADGAQIMRMARTELYAEEVEGLVDWIAARLGRAPGEIPDSGLLGRLEYVVRYWLEPDQRRQLVRAMAGRRIRGAPPLPFDDEENPEEP